MAACRSPCSLPAGACPAPLGLQMVPACSSLEIVPKSCTAALWLRAGVTPAQIPTSVADGVGHFSVSRDERILVYGRLTGGAAGELVVKNLVTGDQRVFAEHQLLGVSIGSIWPQVSPDGKQVIYRVIGAQGGHYLLQLE